MAYTKVTIISPFMNRFKATILINLSLNIISIRHYLQYNVEVLPLGLAPVDFPLVLFGFTEEAVVDSLALTAVVVATGELAPPSATAAAGSRDNRERVIILYPCLPLTIPYIEKRYTTNKCL